jgi:ABC-type polysaccharide/polyol phosphate export permease
MQTDKPGEPLSQLDGVPFYDSERSGSNELEELREVLRYRDLIYQLVRRDIVARYKRSILGVAWTMLNPLAMMIVLTLVFSQLFKTVEGYPAYILSGLVAWTFLSQTTTAAINSLVWGGDFFQKIYVPRSIFAISAIGTGMVNLSLSMIPLLAVMLIVRVPIRPTIIFAPIPIILLACFALGAGLLISSLAVYFPDVVEMYQIVLMIWFYLTPILYPLDILPDQIRTLIQFNPLLPIINLFRLPIYDGRIPTPGDLLPAVLVSLITLGLGWLIFTRKSDEFVYRT